jgi:uncharacterized protein (TIGR02246 family)
MIIMPPSRLRSKLMLPLRLFALAVLAASGSPAWAQSPAACAPVSKEQIAALTDQWNAAVASGDPDAVARLYADDAVVLPMLSMEPRMGRPAIKAYFDQYVKRHPQGGVNMRAIMLGCNTASDIGTYVYRLTGRRKGTREAIGGRYSTSYELRSGQWLIVQQQTTAMNVGEKRLKKAGP